jgi:hypothetical protein
VKKFTQALSAIALALLPAYVLSQGGISYSTGSGSGGITSGTTVVSGCGDGTVIFNLAGVASCDADMAFATDTLTVTKIAGTTLTGSNVATSDTTFGSAAAAADSIALGETAGRITFEGSTANNFETRLGATDPTVGDQVILLPDIAVAGTATLLATIGSNVMSATGSITIADDGSGTDAPYLRIGGATGSTIKHSSGFQTAPSLQIGLHTNNYMLVSETGDKNFNYAVPAHTNPAIRVVSAAQNTTNYMDFGFYGSAGKAVKTLTESAATSTMRIPVTAEAGSGGSYYYTIYATDGSTPQVRQGRVIYSVTNDGGTETCVLGTPEETDNTPTGTLTVTVTCDTTPTNAVDIQLNAVSSLVQTTLEAYSGVSHVGPGEPLPQ